MGLYVNVHVCLDVWLQQAQQEPGMHLPSIGSLCSLTFRPRDHSFAVAFEHMQPSCSEPP